MFRYPQFCPDCHGLGCPRCDGIGTLIVTETTDQKGNLICEETPDSIYSAHFKYHWIIVESLEAFLATHTTDRTSPEYIDWYDFDFTDAFNSGAMTDPILMRQIPKEHYWVLGLCHRANNEFLIIFGSYGFYLPSPDGYFYTPYEQIVAVIEKEDRLVITCRDSVEDRKPRSHEILRTPENNIYMRYLHTTLQKITEA